MYQYDYRSIKLKSLLSILFIFLVSTFNFTNACTRVLLAKPGKAILVGNNMDWFEDMKTNLIVYPRGITHDNHVTGKSLKWTSTYGSIVATAYENYTVGGMNERGLAAHLLGLDVSDYGKRDENQPGLSIISWAQFYLDNFSTVNEAIHYTENNFFQIVNMTHPRVGQIKLHLALEDATGDSAIIEYINGAPHIYHDKQYAVLTNAPTLDQQLLNLQQYIGFGGDKPLPGTTFPKDRFVRATYYLKNLSEFQSTQEGIFKLLSVLQNAGQPFGNFTLDRAEHDHIFESIWRTISDLTNHIYYFNSTMRFNIFWVDLNKFNLAPNAPIMKLNLENKPELLGEVSQQFESM